MLVLAKVLLVAKVVRLTKVVLGAWARAAVGLTAT
jgi:hypothetical protein